MKLTDHTCACNDLINFKCIANTITGNGSSTWKNSWNHIKLTLFLADFSHLKTTVRPPPTAQNMHYSFCSSAFYACIPEDFILAHNLIILGTIVHQKRFYFGRQLRSLLCAFAMEKNREGIIEVSRYQIQFKNFSANSASNPRVTEW